MIATTETAIEVVQSVRPRGAKKAAFLRHVRAGLRPREAAAAAGVAYSTYYRWAESATIRDEVQREEALCELTLVLCIPEAAKRGSYRAAMFLLERRYPERWGEARTVRPQWRADYVRAVDRRGGGSAPLVPPQRNCRAQKCAGHHQHKVEAP